MGLHATTGLCTLLVFMEMTSALLAGEITPPRITAVRIDQGDQVTFNWSSAAGQVYDISATTNLITGTWSSLTNRIAAAPPENQLALAVTNNASVLFFRIGTAHATDAVDILATLAEVEDANGQAVTNFLVQVLWSPDATISPPDTQHPTNPGGNDHLLWEDIIQGSPAYQREESVGQECLNGYAYIRVFKWPLIPGSLEWGESAATIGPLYGNNTVPPPFPNLLLEPKITLSAP